MFVSTLFISEHIFHLIPFAGNPDPAPEKMVYVLLFPFGLAFKVGVVVARMIARGVNLAFSMSVLIACETLAHIAGVESLSVPIVALTGISVGACASAACENMGSVTGFIAASVVGYFLGSVIENSGEDLVKSWQLLGESLAHVPMIVAFLVVVAHVAWGFLTHSGEDDPGDTATEEIQSIYQADWG